MGYPKDFIDEYRGYSDWHVEWRAAIAVVNFERMTELLFDAKAMGDPDHSSVYAEVRAALRERPLVASEDLLDLLLELLPVHGWSLAETLGFIDVLFPNRGVLSSIGAVALLGDWISQYAEVVTGKRQMIQMLRDRPNELGDVLFSMKTRLFPRLAPDDAVNARRVYDHIYAVQEEPTAEWVAQQFEAIWPAQPTG